MRAGLKKKIERTGTETSWTTFKRNFKKKYEKNVYYLRIRSRAVRPPSCVHFYVPFCRISAIRYTDTVHRTRQPHTYRYTMRTPFTNYTHPRRLHSYPDTETNTHRDTDTRYQTSMENGENELLRARLPFFKFYFQFTHSRMLGFS